MAAKIIKWSFFTFNLLVLIFGVLVIAVGVSGHHEAGLAVLSNILIGVGFLAALLGFIGCFGAAKEIRPLLTAYFLIVLLLLTVEVLLGVYIYLDRRKFVNKLVVKIQHAIRNRYAKGDKMSLFITVGIDLYQKEVHCCGMKGPYDYHHSYWQNATSERHDTVPTSCCVKKVKNCNVNVTFYKTTWMTNRTIMVSMNHNRLNSSHSNHTVLPRSYKTVSVRHTGMKSNDTRIYEKGCLEMSKAWFHKSMLDFIKAGVSIGVMEMFGILCALYLWCSTGDEGPKKIK